MARRQNKIDLEKVDSEIEEVGATSIINGDPNMKKIQVGDQVYVNIPLFSRRVRLYRQEQKQKGLLTDDEYSRGCIKLEDGSLLEINTTYDIVLTPEIKNLLKFGILRGGGRVRQKKYAPRMETRSILDDEKNKEVNYGNN